MKREKRIGLFILILALSASLLSALGTCVPHASCELFEPADAVPYVFISPVSSMVIVGRSFTVNVDVASFLELHSLQFKLVWNASILNVTAAAEGGFLSSGGGQTFFFDEVSTPVGGLCSMYVGCTLLGNVAGVSGDGTIASITFLATGLGRTPLDISETSFNEVDGEVVVGALLASSPQSEERISVCGQQSEKAAAPADPVWTVRDPAGGPSNFPNIQAAINSPNVANGDTIHVFAGVDPAIVVTKTLRIIGQCVAGAVAPVCTINGGGANAVTIRADNVFISEFIITGGNAGILCATWNGLTVSNNNITANRVGIALFKSANDIIIGQMPIPPIPVGSLPNSIANNLCGVLLWGSTSVMIRANDIQANLLVGIQLIPPVTGKVYYNNFVNNGVHVWPVGCGGTGVAIVWDDNAVYGSFKGNYWVQPPVPCPGDRGPLPAPWTRHKEDVNVDGTVNIIDIAIAAQAFGTKWSDTRWNPKADIDGNCMINIVDIAKIAKMFGWKDP